MKIMIYFDGVIEPKALSQPLKPIISWETIKIQRTHYGAKFGAIILGPKYLTFFGWWDIKES